MLGRVAGRRGLLFLPDFFLLNSSHNRATLFGEGARHENNIVVRLLIPGQTFFKIVLFEI